MNKHDNDLMFYSVTDCDGFTIANFFSIAEAIDYAHQKLYMVTDRKTGKLLYNGVDDKLTTRNW